MRADLLIEEFERQTADLLKKQTVEIFKKLVLLFGEMKEVQPNLKRLYIGMGTYTIDGDYIVEYNDFEDESNTDEIIGKIDEELVIYKGLANDSDFAEQINDCINSQNNAVFNASNHMNKACIEFVKLCNYIQEINMTTLFSGVNENGVIVDYGAGSHLDTYMDAVESIEVELLVKNKIPIIFHQTHSDEYYKYTHLKY